MKTFEVSFCYQDRESGNEESTVKVEASSLPGAVAKATRQFVKGLDRKQRFDMNKNGLEIKAGLVGNQKNPSPISGTNTKADIHVLAQAQTTQRRAEVERCGLGFSLSR